MGADPQGALPSEDQLPGFMTPCLLPAPKPRATGESAEQATQAPEEKPVSAPANRG